jgi:quinoprotein glucose dehydrogenase
MRFVVLFAMALSAQELKLTQAWVYDTRDSIEAAKGGGRRPALEVTPVYEGGRLYIATPWGTVAALDADNGTEVWRVSLNVNPRGSYGDFVNRGVTLRGARLYTGTVDGRLVCLEKATGARCAKFGERGEIDLTKGLRRGPRWVGEYEITSAPAIFEDMVISGSAIADNSRAEMASGEVRAFDAETGALRWTFYPLPADAKAGGANTWSRIVADESTGLVFLPTGSASPDYYGGLRPGPNNHANSVVALHGRSGRVAWSFQTVRHDLWDYDVASPPALYDVNGKKAIAVGSKTGHLFLLDRLTGKPLFPIEERRAPASSADGESAATTQPFPTKPAALVRHHITEADIWGATPKDRDACLNVFRQLRNEGIFTPPSEQGSLVIPGNVGGMHWGGAAWVKENDMLVMPLNDLPAIVRLIPQDVFRGAASKFPERETTEQKGARFAMSREFFRSPNGTPCIAPPWGWLAGVHTKTGEIAWKVKFGDFINLGGAAISKRGVAFLGADISPYLRAFDTKTGKQLGQWPLPTSARATPAIYSHKGREYVIIAAGGHDVPMSKLDTKIAAFRIDE